jgi:hypothetical protein
VFLSCTERYSSPAQRRNRLARLMYAGPTDPARHNLTGALQATLARGLDLGSPASSADGTILAVGASTGVETVSNAGGSTHLLPVPGVDPRIGCAAVRWWACSAPALTAAPTADRGTG